jgi:hypothetical protein
MNFVAAPLSFDRPDRHYKKIWYRPNGETMTSRNYLLLTPDR